MDHGLYAEPRNIPFWDTRKAPVERWRWQSPSTASNRTVSRHSCGKPGPRPSQHKPGGWARRTINWGLALLFVGLCKHGTHLLPGWMNHRINAESITQLHKRTLDSIPKRVFHNLTDRLGSVIPNQIHSE